MGGTKLGPYRLVAELGVGGMGTVWRAEVEGHVPGLEPGAVVAVKVVHPHLVGSPAFLARFLREAEFGRSVVHANVVRTLHAGEDAEGGACRPFLVMEYVEGQTLRALIDEVGRIPEQLCRHIGRELARGLAAIHAAGVVHRDLKPENALITREQQVKVMDLGIARLADETLRLSQTGAFVGSIAYAAPECFRKDLGPPDHRADLHSLGLVLYELATAETPYDAPDVHGVIRRVLEDAPRRVGDLNPQISPFLEEVVHTLLAKRPGERFATAAEVAEILETGEESGWWKARAKAIRAETRRPLRRIRIPRETAVYGREAEIARLTALFAKAKSGEGQVVFVEGEAGIGKSRLVDEFVGRLRQSGEDLDFLFGSYPPGGAANAAGALSTAFREHLGDADLAEAVRECLGPARGLAPAFAALLLGAAPPAGAEPLTRDSLQTCFVAATRSLAARRTTVLLVDDLHFASEDARALFASLALAVPGHRILLVGTTRPGVDERWLASLTCLPHASQTVLPRLGAKDLARMLEDSFRSRELAAQLGHQIALKSDGNPFFVSEIVRGLREARLIRQLDDGTWTSTCAIDEIRVPSSLLDLVNARVAELSQEERDVLDVASCVGFEFDASLIAEVMGLARIPLYKRLAQIERAHRLVRSSGRNFVFDHHQVQEALYGSLPEVLREEYHAALAAAVESRAGAAGRPPETLDGALCVDLCEHFLRGARGDRALRYLAAAQTYLAQGCRNDAAIRLAERALAVPGLLAGVERARTLLRLCGVESPLDRLGRRARQEECAREAERLAEEAGEHSLVASASRTLGSLFALTSRNEEAEAAQRRALAIAAERGDRSAEAIAAGLLAAVSYNQGRFAEALAFDERSLAIRREIGDRQGVGRVAVNLANTLCAMGRTEEARALYAEALAIARELGDPRGEVGALANLANDLLDRGRLAEAQELYERSLAIAREIGDRRSETVILSNVGPLWLVLGDMVRARQALESGLALTREIGNRMTEAFVLHRLGQIADEEGDHAAAMRLFEDSLALRRTIGHADGVGDSLCEIGDLRRRVGDVALARAALEEARSVFHGLGRAAEVATCLALLACLPGGDAPAAAAALAAVVDDSDAMRVRFALWEATSDREHLAEAKRRLEFLVAHTPPERRRAVVENVRLHREIVAAAGAQGL